MNGNLLLQPGYPLKTKDLPSSKMILTSAALSSGEKADLYIQDGNTKIILAKFKKNKY